MTTADDHRLSMTTARLSTTAPPARARALAVAAGVLAAVAADVAFDPAHRHVPLCPFRAVTGLDCPLCGGLRAVAALARGQWQTALRDNLLVVLAVLPAVVLLAGWLATGRAPRAASRSTTVALIVLATAFTVVRNLPAGAFLRP